MLEGPTLERRNSWTSAERACCVLLSFPLSSSHESASPLNFLKRTSSLTCLAFNTAATWRMRRKKSSVIARISFKSIKLSSASFESETTANKKTIIKHYIIGHFWVINTLTFKTRPGFKPFLWKWNLFAWEQKIIFQINSSESALSLALKQKLGELWNGILTQFCKKTTFLIFILTSKRWVYYRQSYASPTPFIVNGWTQY